MAKEIKELRWRPRWVSHLGCLKGCLEYLGLDISDAWLYGATGHAFVINIHEVVCTSGPTAWMTEMLFRLAPNIGYAVRGVFGHKGQDDFGAKQRRAWELVRRAIDEGLPCYGWELEMPEFYVIKGYDDVGYYYSGPGCDDGKGAKAWQEVGDSEIGVLEMYSVSPHEAADEISTVKAALSFALQHAKSPEKWIYPKYKAGLAGYDAWIRALQTETAEGFGVAYNAAVWSECRGFAVAFLQEAQERMGGQHGALFDEARGHYQVVAQELATVAQTFPFQGRQPEHIADATRRETAIEWLQAARSAEEAGLLALKKIVDAL